jgi:membrane associated rhomboid family serine protease
MFPLRDHNPTRRTPWVTYGLIALNLWVWARWQGFGFPEPLLHSLCERALIPGALLGFSEPGSLIPLGSEASCRLGEHNPWSVVTSMFMHGGWLHLLGNMWFLFVFGDNVEDRLGPVRYGVFYLLSGVAAATAQILTAPASVVPMVGASGAIGGVLGAYAVFYPRARVDLLVFLGFFVTRVAIPAALMLLYWFAIQVLAGLPSLGQSGGGVAFWAHIGGFLAGVGWAVLEQIRSPALRRRKRR